MATVVSNIGFDSRGKTLSPFLSRYIIMINKRLGKLRKLKANKRKCIFQPFNTVSDHELALELNNIYDKQIAARDKIRSNMENKL